MKIGIACDHAGYELKEMIKKRFEDTHTFIDYGTQSAESADYPDFAHALAKGMGTGEVLMGVAICGSGNGINMTLNKHQHIRAALCWNKELAELAKSHNNANVISLPARFVSADEAVEMVDSFLKTEFEGGRHARRVSKIACA